MKLLRQEKEEEEGGGGREGRNDDDEDTQRKSVSRNLWKIKNSHQEIPVNETQTSLGMKMMMKKGVEKNKSSTRLSFLATAFIISWQRWEENNFLRVKTRKKNSSSLSKKILTNNLLDFLLILSF